MHRRCKSTRRHYGVIPMLTSQTYRLRALAFLTEQKTEELGVGVDLAESLSGCVNDTATWLRAPLFFRF